METKQCWYYCHNHETPVEVCQAGLKRSGGQKINCDVDGDFCTASPTVKHCVCKGYDFCNYIPCLGLNYHAGTVLLQCAQKRIAIGYYHFRAIN